MAARILVLSGNSNVGSEAIRRLLAADIEVRAGVRNKAKAQPLADAGAEIVEADLERPETLDRALEGINHVLLSTSVAQNIAELHGRLYAPAKAAGIGHIVRISAIGADPKAKVALGRTHGQAEKDLEATGIGWTHLRPHSFMQNFLASAHTIAAEGKIYSCMGQGKVPHVDVRDIAAAAIVCLTQPGHMGRTYEITGPESLTMNEVADRIGQAIGHKVEYVDIPADAWIGGAVSAGIPEWIARDLAHLYANVFAKNYASNVSSAVPDLTGRDGISVARFARDYAHMFRGATQTA